MSNAGNPWLRTPTMDHLAAQGVTIEQTYCSDPIGVPSRELDHRPDAAPKRRDLPHRETRRDRHAPKDKAWHGFGYTRLPAPFDFLRA